MLLNVDERDSLARDIAEQMAEPGLWLLPVIALVLGLAIRRGLRPLHELSRDVHALDVSKATALPAHQPRAEFNAQAALDASHELALVAPCTFPINGHAVLLEMALRNLIENALGHTPPGTTVEVQLDARARWLQVCDDGLRVAAAGRVADAAGTTALGLGLGHRVVEKIAGLHGAGFAAVPAPVGFDTCYRVDFGADVES